MKLSVDVPVGAARERLQAVLADRARVIRCIPGVDSVEPEGEGFALRAGVGLGPVKLRFTGQATVRDDDGGWVADVSLHDSLSGSVYGTFRLRPGDATVGVDADVTLGGRLGEFAAAILRQKAEKTVREFAVNLARLAQG